MFVSQNACGDLVKNVEFEFRRMSNNIRTDIRVIDRCVIRRRRDANG